MYAHTCVCACPLVFRYMYVCGGQRAIMDIILRNRNLPLLRQSLSVIWNSPNRLGYLDKEPQDSAFSALALQVLHHTYSFYMGCEVGT